MTFANCPKCGSSNVTTAGDCADCGWKRFHPQVMDAGGSKEAIYNLVGEIEIKVSGKALLDDYKRLLFENNKLTARIAELEAELGKDVDLTIVGLRKELLNAQSRIAELEADNAEFRQLIRDWSIVLDQNDEFQLWQVESVRQAMLEINKEREG